MRFVVVPYLIISTLTISAGLLLKHNESFGIMPLAYIAWSIWTGGTINAPLWFIPMICFFFAAAPIFLAISRSRFHFAVLIITLAFSLLSSRPFINTNPVLSFLHFAGFYMLGIVISKRKEIGAIIENLSISMIAAFLLMIFWAYCEQQKNAHLPEYGFFSGIYLINFVQVGKLLMLIFIYKIVSKYLNKRIELLSYVANISFGLFFIHYLWKILADKAIAYLAIQNPISTILFEIMVIAVGSLVCIEITRKVMKKRSRYVIGC